MHYSTSCNAIFTTALVFSYPLFSPFLPPPRFQISQNVSYPRTDNEIPTTKPEVKKKKKYPCKSHPVIKKTFRSLARSGLLPPPQPNPALMNPREFIFRSGFTASPQRHPGSREEVVASNPPSIPMLKEILRRCFEKSDGGKLY